MRVYDSAVHFMPLRVRLSDLKRLTTHINTDSSGVAPPLKQLNNKRNRKTSRPNTEIHEAKGALTPGESQSLLNDKL
jgi:hypothetical protein